MTRDVANVPTEFGSGERLSMQAVEHGGLEHAARAKILVVDDHASNLLALEGVLAPLGRDVVRAQSGTQALRHLETTDFAIVLLDVQMPTMDGFEVAARMKQIARARSVPIIFFTAIKLEPSYVAQAYAAGGVDFLHKPFEAESLRGKVSVFVDLFEAREQSRRAAQAAREREQAELRALVESTREEAIRLRAANRSKDEILRAVSREVRAPVNTILGWVRMLRSGSVQGDQRERALEIIERNASAQLKLARQVADLTRIANGTLSLKVGSVDLADTAHLAVETARQVASARKLHIDAIIDKGLTPIRGDADRLGQIVSVLLDNAIKSTTAGGVITVRLRKKDSAVDLRRRADATPAFASLIELSVEDTGEGFDPAFASRVFESTADEEQDGAHKRGGLGLAIAQHLTVLHGGTIAAFSEGVGKGSRFVVTLPAEGPSSRTLPSAPTLPPSSSRHLPDLHGMRVLVVDDDEDGRTLLSALLEQCGASVTAASNAAQALASFEGARPHAVVSELELPGQDGFSFLEALRRRPHESGGGTPAVAVTDSTRKDDRRRAAQCGFDSLIRKPVEPSELLGVIANIWRRAGAAE